MNTYAFYYVDSSALAALEVDGQVLSDVVFDVFFGVTVSDGTLSADYRGNITLPQPTTLTGFTPAADVTREMIMGWAADELAARDAADAAYMAAQAAYDAEGPDQADDAPVPPPNMNYGLAAVRAAADALLATKAAPPIVQFTPAS